MRIAHPGLAIVIGLVAAQAVSAAEYLSGIVWKEPPVIAPVADSTGAPPPSDAIILFGGEDLSAWNGGDSWQVADGVATAAKRDITTKQSFGDCQLHLEWASPDKVSGSGQGRGNSGVFLMDRYEIQILDSYDNTTYFDGQCAALYKQRPPLFNASRKPGEWQTYDIFFRAPRFNQGKLITPGYVTVIHNGVLVQNNTEIKGNTAWDSPPAYKPHPARQPLHLQFHGNPVRFRNIWVRDLMDREDENSNSVASRAAELADDGPVEAPAPEKASPVKPKKPAATTPEKAKPKQPEVGAPEKGEPKKPGATASPVKPAPKKPEAKPKSK